LEPASGFPVSPQVPAQEPTEPASPKPRLLVQPAGIELNLPVDKDVYVIGREDPASGSYPEVDLVPYGGEEGGVSRRHAQITRSGQDYFIEDLNSVNYTFVNRQKIPASEPYPLRDGDEIRLGRVLLRFKTN
jgi:pSer/pThr/pTyr-binding forkhead associated (FHA) protein